MQRQSKRQRESLQTAVSRYHSQLSGSPAEEYLNQRGLAQLDGIDKYRFGYVEDPFPEHEQHRGKLAIPYLRRHPRYGWTCIAMRFRALEPNAKPKYASLAGDPPHIFNTPVLNMPSLDCGIAEGEIDAATATLCGLPTVGVPGANMWQPHWKELFEGYRTVYIFADGDEPGEKAGNKITKALPNSKMIVAPKGEDINSLFQKEGVDRVKALWGGNMKD